MRDGFLKRAADRPELTPEVEAVHRAVAWASIASVAPIMAHSNPAIETGIKQIDISLREGVPPSSVVIAHTGDTDDLAYIERLLAKGCYIGMDRFGLENILSDESRSATVMRMIERGYAGQMILGQDCVAQLDIDLPLKVPNWHMKRLLSTFFRT